MPISATGSKVRASGFTSLRRSAEHGFTPLRRSAEHGFTLVELMVVIAIIALATAVVVFAIPDPRGKVIADAERFAVRAAAARDDAILQSRDVRLSVTPSGYATERMRQGRWQPVTAKPFGPASWSAGTGALVGAEGRVAIIFDSTGAVATPIVLTLARDSERAVVRVSTDGAVRVGS